MIINPPTSSTPFALIDKVSYFEAEQEVLFSMHTIFRIGEINKIKNDNQLHQVTLTLTNDNYQQLQTLTEQIQEETSLDEKGWYRMGELPMKLDQFDKAEQYNRDDYDEALLFYKKST